MTLAFCQDVQAEAHDWPEAFFAPRTWHQRRVRPDLGELAAVTKVIKSAKSPVIVAGGGTHYSGATDALLQFAEEHQIPVVETQAGKSALPWDHPLNMGPVGVTGAASANAVCEMADVPSRKLISVNVAAYDAMKHGALPLQGDALVGLNELTEALKGYKVTAPDASLKADWFAAVDPLTDAPADSNALPTDSQVIGAVQRSAGPDTVVMSPARWASRWPNRSAT